jgi:hypothetical protein
MPVDGRLNKKEILWEKRGVTSPLVLDSNLRAQIPFSK